MIKILSIWIAAVTVLIGSEASQAAAPPTPTSIRASIRKQGAEATIATLAKTDQWDAVADRMGGGEPRWIALAPELAPGSDAGSAEDLGIALAFSLPKSPQAVLAALDPANGHVLGAGRVCGMPFIENTVKDRPAYKRHAIFAVKAVAAPSLAKAKAACLRELERAS